MESGSKSQGNLLPLKGVTHQDLHRCFNAFIRLYNLVLLSASLINWGSGLFVYGWNMLKLQFLQEFASIDKNEKVITSCQHGMARFESRFSWLDSSQRDVQQKVWDGSTFVLSFLSRWGLRSFIISAQHGSFEHCEVSRNFGRITLMVCDVLSMVQWKWLQHSTCWNRPRACA